ncbi:MAG: hypothetical protein ABIT37_04435 [Luteolibacter sp.]
MMKSIVHINVSKMGGTVEFMPALSENDFYELGNWAKNNRLLFDSPNSMTDSELIISFDESRGFLPELLARFERYGLKPHPRMLLFGADPKREFGYKINRKFERKDLLDVKYFDLMWGGRNDCFPRDEILEIKHIKELSKGWATQFARKFGFHPLLCNDEGRKILMENHIKGIEFMEMPFDKPPQRRGNFYSIATNQLMPNCLLPVGTGVEGVDGMKVYLDGPYDPPILQFRRSEVEALGGFDVAYTREIVESSYMINERKVNRFPHRMIASAKLVNLLKDAKVKHEAIPVRLV